MAAVDLRASKTGYLTLDHTALYIIFCHILTINYGRKYKHAFRPSKSRRVFLMRGSFANK